jgi:hypothetical protein
MLDEHKAKHVALDSVLSDIVMAEDIQCSLAASSSGFSIL